MSRCPRSRIVDPDQIQVFHAWSHCVRRCFLMGFDECSGKNYDHRRQWIYERQRDLAKYFAIDILSTAILSNHMHHVLRTRPDIVRQMNDDEVARRWLGICPKRRHKDGTACEPTDAEIEALKRERKFKKLRSRLSSISWFQRMLKQATASMANNEDHPADGRFWSGRFKATLLDSEEAVLACSIYVDLNLVRAGVAQTPEQSKFTSLYDRLVAHRARNSNESSQDDRETDCWLAPIFATTLPRDQRFSQRGLRASDTCSVDITFEQYAKLADWTGRQICEEKRGAIPPDLAPILERLNIDANLWVDSIDSFGEWSRLVVANASRMADKASALGRQFLHGVRRCRELFPN